MATNKEVSPKPELTNKTVTPPPSTIFRDITTLDDVWSWFAEMLADWGLGWHPEDPFDWDETPQYNDLFNKMMDAAYTVCEEADIDICEIAMDVSRPYRHSFGLGIDEIYYPDYQNCHARYNDRTTINKAQ
jgi:RimJ/RimL family protein N-acetyltransferase